MKYSKDNMEELLAKEGIALSEDKYSYDNSGVSVTKLPNGLTVYSKPMFDLYRCYWCLWGYKDPEKKALHEQTCENKKRGFSEQMQR